MTSFSLFYLPIFKFSNSQRFGTYTQRKPRMKRELIWRPIVKQKFHCQLIGEMIISNVTWPPVFAWLISKHFIYWEKANNIHNKMWVLVILIPKSTVDLISNKVESKFILLALIQSEMQSEALLFISSWLRKIDVLDIWVALEKSERYTPPERVVR